MNDPAGTERAESYLLHDVHIQQPSIQSLKIFTNHSGEAMVTFTSDGHVAFGRGYDPDEAARAFWLHLSHANPVRAERDTAHATLARLAARLGTTPEGVEARVDEWREVLELAEDRERWLAELNDSAIAKVIMLPRLRAALATPTSQEERRWCLVREWCLLCDVEVDILTCPTCDGTGQLSSCPNQASHPAPLPPRSVPVSQEEATE